MIEDMAMNDSLKFENLITGYKTGKLTTEISRGISGEIRPGAVTCLLGPNGAGKSTLMRTIAGFIPPLGGEVRLCGRVLGQYSQAELSRKIGVVLTAKGDADYLTVREMVALGRSPYTGFWGSLGPHDREIVDEAMASMRINDIARRRVNTLSDGQRQKTMIAKVLAQQTGFVLLDEPTAFLDFPSKVEVFRMLRQLAVERNIGILLSTHDVEMALNMAGNVWVLDNAGALVAGAPGVLAGNGTLANLFPVPGVRLDADNLRFDYL